MHLDALKLVDALRDRLTELALEDGQFRDGPLRDRARALWSGPPEQGGLVGELWVEGAFPAESSGETLRDLAARGVVHQGLVDQLERTNAMPPGRSLYTHQRDALTIVHEARGQARRPGLVVTAGTGAGKTESFLLPLLDELWRTPGRPGQGMSALLLYPMNALVVDQVKRLASWLEGQTRICFFHFTSETPENHDRACKAGLAPQPLPCFRTRQQARGFEDTEGEPIKNGGGRTPDVVVTNYSMLEYMLCRPQDGAFFGENLRVVVLDEAHLYNGTLAAEIALLLRRLLERCNKRPEDVLFLAASATLGAGTQEQIRAQLRAFGTSLSSKPADTLREVIGSSQLTSFQGPAREATQEALHALLNGWSDVETLCTDKKGQVALLEDADQCERLRPWLETFCFLPREAATETHPAVLLHEALAGCHALREAARFLFTHQRVPLAKLAEALWGSLGTPDTRLLATTRLLALGAAARRSAGDLPLLPHRLHAPARGSEGLSVCLSPACTGPHPLEGRGSLLGEHRECCPFCQAIALPLLRCETCGEPLLVSRGPRASENGVPEEEDYVRGWVTPDVPGRPLYFQLGLQGPGPALCITPATGEIEGGEPQIRLHRVPEQQEQPRCPGCQEPLPATKEPEASPDDASSRVRAYQSGAPLTTLLLAETMLAALPPLSSPLSSHLPAEGRRLLAFSDSRRSAARLGPLLTESHARRVFQATLAQFLGSSSPTSGLQVLQKKLAFHRGLLADDPDNVSLQEDVANLTKQIAAQQQGHRVAGLPASLISNSAAKARLAQLLHPDEASNQEPPWSQQAWKQNHSAILANEHLIGLLGQELARRSAGQRTLENLGLVEMRYPGLDEVRAPDALLALLPEAARSALEPLWPTILALLCDTLRGDGCITLGNDERDKEYPFGEGWLGRWTSFEQGGWRCVAFSGSSASQRRRAFASATLQRLGVPSTLVDELSRSLLHHAFQQLHAGKFPWIEVDSAREISPGEVVLALRLRFCELAVRSPERCWRSPTSGRVWSRAIQAHERGPGLAPELGCADLVRVSPEELNRDPGIGRARRELLDPGKSTQPSVFHLGLWAEEHSAQRSPQTNRNLQGLFEQGARNLLSASTTLEVGIDIGGLNGVLLANAPPSKASYLQRAGRAGRRTDGSSIVAVFCRPRPFDHEVFLRFERYIGRPLRRPCVLFERERIALRHAHAWLLGDFFRQQYAEYEEKSFGAMLVFGRLGAFVGLELPAWWDKGMSTCPPLPPWKPNPLSGRFRQHLRSLAQNPPERAIQALAFLLQGTPAASRLRDWAGLLRDVEEAFARALEGFLEDLRGLAEVYKNIPAPGGQLERTRAMARSLWRQLDTLASTTVIEALSDRQFLPKFGFPVGLHRLKVMVPDERRPERLREEDSIRLERSSLLALAEYVPGAQVLVGGKVVTSRGVLRHFVGNEADDTLGQRGTMITCDKGHSTYAIATAPEACHFCGGSPKRRTSLLLPRHGFLSAGWDPPSRGIEIRTVGSTEQVTITFGPTTADEHRIEALAGVPGLEARYREDGEILVFNRGKYRRGFALCTSCGFADSEHKETGQGAVDLPKSFAKHAPLTSSDPRHRCWKEGEAPVLRHHTLAARQTTDILLITARHGVPAARPQAFAETLGRALQIAGARLLEVDPRELGVLVTPNATGYSVALYDNIPGGVGHVRELLDLGKDWLQAARDVLFLDAAHDRRCQGACLDCILTFDAQQAAARGMLDRSLVLAALDIWLSKAAP